MLEQRAQRRRPRHAERGPLAVVEAPDEVLDQEGHILSPLAERRQLDGEYAEPVVEVAAKRAGLHHAAEVTVGSGDQADVEPARHAAAEGADLAVLDDAQQLRLEGEGEVFHLVEEERAPVRQLERARPFLEGAGEGAARVAEELALGERLGYGRAVDRHEGARGAPAEAVHRARDHLLAGARLALDQHVRLGVRGRTDERAHLVDRAAAADEARESLAARGSGVTAETGGRCGACQTRDGLRHPREPLGIAQYHVVAGSGLHGLDGSVGRVPTAHHEDGEVAAAGAQRPYEIRSAGVRPCGADDEETRPGVVRRGSRVARRRRDVRRRTRPPRRRGQRRDAQRLVVEDEDTHGADT